MNADPSFSLRRALTTLQTRNVALPESFSNAVQLWNEVSASRQAEPPVTALRDAIIAQADEVGIGSALLLDLGAGRLATAWQQAINETASRALRQLLEHRDEIHAQLRAQADKLIAKLQATADLGDTPLNTLVREGKHTEARLLADVDTTAAELNALYDFRDHYLIPGGFRALNVGHISCARWRNGPDIDHALHGGMTEGFLSGLRATPRGELWFPTAEEARDAAQRYWNEYEAAETQRQRELFGQGSTVSWA